MAKEIGSLVDELYPEIPGEFPGLHYEDGAAAHRYYSKWNPKIGFLRRWTWRLLGLAGFLTACAADYEVARALGAALFGGAAMERGHVVGHWKGFLQGFSAGGLWVARRKPG